MTVRQQSDELIENPEKPELTCCHYTAKQQAIYLKQSKEAYNQIMHNFGRLLTELSIYT
jgi:hypothetical protein